MAHLRPCSGCARHVRADVTACPFCDAALAIDTRAPAVAGERLGRAARMAFGGAAAVALTVAACDSPKKENIAMPYGAPPNPTPAMPDAGAPSDPAATTATTPTAADAASAPVAASASASPSASPSATASAKTPPKATATAKPVQTAVPPPNHAKPYGAPPADGYGVFDV